MNGFIRGSCRYVSGCEVKCSGFRPSDEDPNICGYDKTLIKISHLLYALTFNFLFRYCKHDPSAHTLIGHRDEATGVTVVFPQEAAPAPPAPLIQTLSLVENRTKTTDERIGMFGTKPRRNSVAKRRLAVEDDEPSMPSTKKSRSSSSSSSSTTFVPAPLVRFLPTLIVMNRMDPVPQSHSDYLAVEPNTFRDIELTTPEALQFHIKVSLLGCDFKKKWYLYSRGTPKTLKATPYWSQNWPEPAAINALCLDRILYVTPDCYEDEIDKFVSSEDSNYIELIEQNGDY